MEPMANEQRVHAQPRQVSHADDMHISKEQRENDLMDCQVAYALSLHKQKDF